MSGTAWLIVALVLMGTTVGYLFGALAVGIARKVRGSPLRPMKDFGLSITLALLFLSSWIGQAISQWQEFSHEQATHGEAAAVGDFLAAFASTTLENWQSEFLQLFAFVVLSAVLIHRGSAESKDSDERIEQSLSRIEAALGTGPDDPSPHDVRPPSRPSAPT